MHGRYASKEGELGTWTGYHPAPVADSEVA